MISELINCGPPEAGWLDDYGLRGEKWLVRSGSAGGFCLRIVNQRLWPRADCFLGPREKAIRPRGDFGRSQEWLLGRLAAKLAAGWLLELDINNLSRWLELAPQVEILPDPLSGAPVVWPADNLGPHIRAKRLYLTLSHTVLADGSRLASGMAAVGACPGLDLERRNRRLSAGFLAYAFSARESRLWPAGDPRIPLWVWCAKEAAAKSLRTGLIGHLKSFALTALAPDLTWADIHCSPGEADGTIKASLFEARDCLGAWVLEAAGPGGRPLA